MKWTIESHAVERFIQRVAPGLTFWEAEKILRRAFPERAIPLGKRSIHGDQQWEMTDYPAILITKRENRTTVLVTVLEKKEDAPSMTEEEVEEMLRAYYLQLPKPPEPPVQVPPRADPPPNELAEALGTIQTLRSRIRSLEHENQALKQSKVYLKTARHLMDRAQDRDQMRALVALCIRALLRYGDTEVISLIRERTPYFLEHQFLDRQLAKVSENGLPSSVAPLVMP